MTKNKKYTNEKNDKKKLRKNFELLEDISILVNVLITAAAVIFEELKIISISDILYTISQVELFMLLNIVIMKRLKTKE